VKKLFRTYFLKSIATLIKIKGDGRETQVYEDNLTENAKNQCGKYFYFHKYYFIIFTVNNNNVIQLMYYNY
jgi:hypothetical protein